MTNKIDKIQMPDGQVLKLDGGSGLEVCDIGMALYVDETKGLRRYLNGQIVDINTNTQAFLNRLLEIKNTNPDYFATEENWQSEALLNIDGCVYKFVLNYSGETVVSVRLPKYPDYVEINAGGTLPVVGNGTTLGLTDGTNFGSLRYNSQYGEIGVGSQGYGIPIGTDISSYSGSSFVGTGVGISTDPTKSGIQTTLKQTKLKMRYFIQIATGSETEANIVNTLENVNGFTLLESKYSDKPLYNESWLLSNGQWNPSGVYITAYEGLQVEHNTGIEAGTTVTLPSGVSYTKRGLSVKLSTETYTDYDFVLNTADETFRLPLKTKLASGKAVVGNGMTLGLTNGAVNYGIAMGVPSGISNGVFLSNDSYGAVIGTSTSPSMVGSSNNKTLGLSTDPTKSGIELSDSGLYLYFYVGDIDQNHGIVNMGRIGEQLANKQDKCIHIIDTYINGTSGYRIWSDGYCEQWGGYGTAYTSYTTKTITFLKVFKDTDYYLVHSNSYNGSTYEGATYTKSTNNFSVINSMNYNSLASWKAGGYLAEGEY